MDDDSRRMDDDLAEWSRRRMDEARSKGQKNIKKWKCVRTFDLFSSLARMLLLCRTLHLCTYPRVPRVLLEASLNYQAAEICGECFPRFLAMLDI